MANPQTVAIVYAKSHSSRVRRKNMRLLGDVPLFWHITATALRCERISQVVVDTDDEDIASYATDHGVRVIDRPKWLASNVATGDDLAANSAEQFRDFDIILGLYPTSPFVTVASLERAITALRSYNSATGITVSRDYLWRDGKPAPRVVPSQQLTPTIRETTGFYAARQEYVFTSRCRVDPRSCFGVVLSHVEAIDIDYEEDFAFAEVVYRGKTAVVGAR